MQTPAEHVVLWKDVTFSIQHKVILESLSGAVRKGELVALLGSSGAGKTTLLDALCGRLRTGHLAGSIVHTVAPEQIGYVQSSDVLLGTLTVRETLQYAARLSKQMSVEDMNATVNATLRDLSLESCADVLVGDNLIRGISTGQRRRLSIGMLLIRGAQFLLCDEPTSGLDAASALRVVSLLRRLCSVRGCTVICTIHQPSAKIFSLFDRAILLATGRCAYYGPTDNVADYLRALGIMVPSQANPADLLLDATSPMRSLGDVGKDKDPEQQLSPGTVEYELGVEDEDETAVQTAIQSEAFLQRLQPLFIACNREPDSVFAQYGMLLDQEQGQKEASGLEHHHHHHHHLRNPQSHVQSQRSGGSPYRVPFTTQVNVLCGRSFRNIMRNPMRFYNELGSYVFLAIFLGLLYLQVGDDQGSIAKRVAAIFMILATFSFVPSLAIIASFPAERAVVTKERDDYMYSSAAYYVAYTLTSLPFDILYVMLFSCICYFMLGFAADAGRFWIFAGVILLFEQVNVSLSILIAAICPTVDLGNVLASVIITIYAAIGGFLLRAQDVKWYFYPFLYTSFYRYGQEALSQNEFRGLTFTGEGYATGDAVLRAYDLQNLSIAGDVGVLIAMLVVYRIGSYFAVTYVRHAKK
jgi:ABC-type multidrug transport system ATPase subunit/ABC-type multidrug transport system permease subunit